MYNKIFTKILDSSIWMESLPTRVVWLTFIAAMDENGFVNFASAANVAHRAIVPLPDTVAAIALLEGEDVNSSDPENNGRRIERVPGGWIVLNAAKYRAIVTRANCQEKTRERVRKHRAMALSNANVTQCNADVTEGNDSVTTSEANQNQINSSSNRNIRASAHTHADTVADAADDDIFQTAKNVMDNDKATLAKSQSQEVVYSWQDWRTEHPRIRIERVGEGNMDDWRHLWKKYGREIMDIMYDRLVKALESGKVIWFNGANTWLNENTSED